MVQKLLKIQNIDVNFIFHGLSPLHFAIFQNNLEIVKELLNHSKIEINKRDNLFFSTPLSKAASKGNLEIVKLLLEKDNSSINYLDKWYRSPLHYASRNGYLEIVKLLLNNDSDVNAKDKDFRESEYYKGVDKHVNNKSEEKIKNKIIYYYGNTPLHFAISYNQQIIVKELLNNPNSKNKIDVNIKNEYDYTPLHVATKEGNLEIVKELLNHPEIDLNIQDNDGNTPLHLFFEDEQNLQDLENENIWQYIKNQIINKVNNFNLYKKDIFKLLIENGADVNIQDNKGISSILHKAIFNENLEIVKELLNHPEIDLNIQDNDGNTPLHFALFKNNLEIVQELIKHKNIDYQKTNKKGEKPINLFCCSKCKNEDIKNILELKSKIQITEKLLEDKSKLIQKQILDLNNKLNFYKKEFENKLISSTIFSKQENETTNEPLSSLQEKISSLKIRHIP
ncbi:hypothetical protein SAP269_01190 [Spiroplasma ixodetis]|uniref:Ankyrin repeat protein n=2 Tax=Spiroplasma ixodetis TaxID=2141 RepID=A0ABM8JNW2_9MOLU